jgi:phospholipid/cholesterol/gamma-HCH transport system substrate-binding protein
MVATRKVETLVGLFLLAAVCAFIVLAIKVSGLTNFFPNQTYQVDAFFDEIGQLKTRAPIKMGGVTIGKVSAIKLDPITFKAIVKLDIDKSYKDIPDDSTASILTAGLLGDNYIAINPMYSKTVLHDGSQIEFTHSAMILENLIGQLIYKIGGNSNNKQGVHNEKN